VGGIVTGDGVPEMSEEALLFVESEGADDAFADGGRQRVRAAAEKGFEANRASQRSRLDVNMAFKMNPFKTCVLSQADKIPIIEVHHRTRSRIL
jgi:hypothetical protein